jgi:hypothetical protein
MQLTKKELALIAKAEKSMGRAKVYRVVLLFILVAGFASMFYGFLSPDYFAYLAFTIVMFALLLPQLDGPPYAQLVELLSRVRASAEHQEIDPLVAVLAKKP